MSLHIFSSTLLILLISFFLFPLTDPPHHLAAAAAGGGWWRLLQRNVGISAMHMQLLHNDRVVMFDRTDVGPSNISLPHGKCLNGQNDAVSNSDCTAHSVEYDVVSDRFRPLTVLSDVWCSSGSVMPDGKLVQTGGYNRGDRRVRMFPPCTNGCDWTEIENGLVGRRWYATNHILPDGRQIIVGGRRQFNFEFFPKTTAPNAYSLPFLVQTNDKGIENNLYPSIFLNTDGHLFIFANNRAILLDYSENKVVKSYPEIPGGDPRSYPSTGSAVLLPLRNLHPRRTNDVVEAEVLVCGGAPKGSYALANKGIFVKALNTCARIKITDPDPKWVMETMPQARVMGDMIILPNGDVLIINGAGSGTAGWERGRDPVLAPDLYRPYNRIGSRFETQTATAIPRMYHSSAVLLRDGRVLVGGSNPHISYNFTGVIFPTELRLEAFHPWYLDPRFSDLRPKILSPRSRSHIGYKKKLSVMFTVSGDLRESSVRVTMASPSFTTHSFGMNQRLLVLGNERLVRLKDPKVYEVEVTSPGSANLAPPGYYMMFVVHRDVPSEGIWVNIQ